jgi:hypothetical protein
MMGSVSRSVGAPGAHAPPPAPPPATRAVAPGWRDPRLWMGVAIVAVCVVAGARLFAAVDDTVSVWATAADLGPGDRLTDADLVAQRVRFADGGDLDHYFTVDQELPADLELTRAVGEGELLPRAAVGAAGGSDTVQVRIAVDNEQVPAAVDAGSVVHVYLLGPADGGGDGGGAGGAPALEAVTVVDAPPVEDNVAATGNRTIDVVVTETQARAYFARRAALDDPVVTVVKVG